MFACPFSRQSMEVAMREPTNHVPTRATKRSLAKRRRKAISILLTAAGGTGSVSAAPTPGLELPKQAVVGLADALVFSNIYQAYFDEDLDEESLRSMLQQTGAAVAVGGGVAYVSIKLTEGLLAEVLNFVPGLGWLISGAVTASITVCFGALWAALCDYSVRNGTSPAAEMRARMQPAGA
jgi:hypothetical protein